MGLDINGTRFLLYARRQGVDFSRTAMIGRQCLTLNAAVLERNLWDFGFAGGARECERLLTCENGYAEPFLRLLGASEIASFDASDYEGANFIHDFNLPLHPRFFGRYTTVLDGGTLEHIFNFPQAIANCMRMVDTGGHFLGITPTNNFVGHGFYQFSPEVFFRVFNSSNGFTLQQMFAFESHNTNWYEVADPAVVKERVTLINGRETYLLITARKTADVPAFASQIQQSDYSVIWQAGLLPGVSSRGAGRWNFLPAPLKWPVRAARGWIHGRRRLGFDGKWFRKLQVP